MLTIFDQQGSHRNGKARKATSPRQSMFLFPSPVSSASATESSTSSVVVKQTKMLKLLLVATMYIGTVAGRRPNFIVMQPDDFEFFERWNPPAHISSRRGNGNVIDWPVNTDLPNLERLRTNGLQMAQAYTASPMCGTSRYSTMTGRYPSRAAYSRVRNSGSEIGDISIPTTKIDDERSVVDGDDCSYQNLAQLFASSNYHTGMVGKWHLASSDRREEYSYEGTQQKIRDCGFSYAEGIFLENLNSGFNSEQAFTHNMEYVTAKAIDFITLSVQTTPGSDGSPDHDPFFLYLNPTVPHNSGDVYEAIMDYSCLDTPEGRLSDEPNIVGMTADYGGDCVAYRQSIIDRAGDEASHNKILGSIWIDDAIGAIFQTLEDLGELDNTFFLFQMDHGQEGKGSLYEQGIRMAQFIHYPDAFDVNVDDKIFDGLVSTIDIGPTMLEYAGIDTTSSNVHYYDMDGTSWKSAVEGSFAATGVVPSTYNDAVYDDWITNRCLQFEIGTDRGVRCGQCEKYIYMSGGSADQSETWNFGERQDIAVGTEVVFDLCDSNGNYITALSDENDNPETVDVSSSNPDILQELSAMADCHLAATYASITETPDFTTECNPDFGNVEEDDSTSSPTGAPTAAPTAEETSAPTLAPTRAPTGGPTLSPTTTPTSGPTTSSICKDAEDYSFYHNNVARTCEWVGNRDRRCAWYGASHCPVECGLC